MSRAALGCWLILALAALLIPGCNRKLKLPLVANQRPEVQLTQAPVATTTPYFYSYELRWAGYDSDGRVDHFLYAVDPTPPPASDTAWVTTTANRQTFLFKSNDPDSLGTVANPGGYHTFVIKAVDDRGLASALVSALLPWPGNAWLLAFLIICAGFAYGSFWTPALSMVSDEAEHFGLDYGYAFALVNIAWAPGQAGGAALGGALASATSDAVPYLGLAAMCTATFFFLSRYRETAAPLAAER